MHVQDIFENDANIKAFPAHPQSWFAMSRELFNHPVVGIQNFEDPWPPTLVWIWMLGAASYKDRTVNCEGHAVFVRRGQMALSLRFIAKKVNWSVKAVRNFLGRLERFGMIATDTVASGPSRQLSLGLERMNVVQRGTERGTGKGTGRTVITVCNYEKYQTPHTDVGTGRGTGRGTAGAQRITIKQEEEKRLEVVGGKIVLYGELLTYWLGRFGGDQQALEDALMKSLPYVHVNAANGHSLETKVSGQLVRHVPKPTQQQGASVSRFPDKQERRNRVAMELLADIR